LRRARQQIAEQHATGETIAMPEAVVGFNGTDHQDDVLRAP